MRSRLGMSGLGVVLAILSFAAPLLAQGRADPAGTVTTGLLLRQLDGVKRVLMIGAHPDDENTALLAALARGTGAETAYLSLTRGDGGQNLLGPELGEGLGIIRTGELEAARRIDGGRQFFTRAFDFGFSKSADEALAHWGHEAILRDIVWIIRSYRPQVVVSVWTGTPRDGHGHHQASGILANEAFEVAADPSRFPEMAEYGLEPWRAQKLYHSAWFRRNEAAVQVPVGSFDPLLGRSHLQVAMDSRSQHRSQDMGARQPMGPSSSGVRLVTSLVDIPAGDDGIFAGVDTTLVGLLPGLPASEVRPIRESLRAYREEIRGATAALDALHPDASAPSLGRAALHMAQASRVAAELGLSDAHREFEAKLTLVHRALLASASIELDARASTDFVVPGGLFDLEILLWNGGTFEVDASVTIAGANRIEPASATRGNGAPELLEGPDEASVAAGSLTRIQHTVAVPEEGATWGMYYLEDPRQGDLYTWSPLDPMIWGAPRDPPPVEVDFDLTVSIPGVATPIPVHARRSVEYVGVDKALGEFREPLLIVPALSVAVDPGLVVWPSSATEARSVSVLVRNESDEAQEGAVSLEVPEGWAVEPARQAFSLAQAGASQSVSFAVRPLGQPETGLYLLRARAVTSDGRSYDRRVDIIDYPHITRTVYDRRADATLSVFPVQIAEGVRVGYIMGSGDDGPAMLRQLGVEVEEVGAETIQAGDFSRFDALILGIRVYETRPDVVAANDQILDFARLGGTVIVQYNKYEYPAGGFAPYEVAMGRPADRVTDEDSPVRMLNADSPALRSPNRLTEEDFEGWVQERGLYFLRTWDDRFTPLLEMSDPGEEPVQGSLLVAPLGDGLYVYTGLSFFRQFPRGVAGAYRLFANLIALDAEDWPRE